MIGCLIEASRLKICGAVAKNPLKILLVHFIEHRRRNRFSRLSDPLTARNNREENERKNRKARTGGRRTQQEDKLKEGTKREEE